MINISDSEIRQRLAREYLDSKHFSDTVSKRLDEIKKALTQDLITTGTPDEKGNLWCPAGDMQIKRERRLSDSFDRQAAEQWIKDNGCWDQVKVTVEVLDEDRLLALGWSNPEVETAIRSFYTQKETWAFKVLEQKSYEDD